jgi:hypothetical protein
MGHTPEHAGNGSDGHLNGAPNLKVNGYCQGTNQVFEDLGCFGLGGFACPIDTSPSVTTIRLHNTYEETIARLQKIKDSSYQVVSIWERDFRKILRDTHGIEHDLSSHPCVKNSPMNIRDAFTGVEPKPAKHYRVEIHDVDVISLHLHLEIRIVSCE